MAAGAGTPISHVVIVVKENHTFDNYFSGFPGADGDLSLPVSPNPPPRDPNHSHQAWLDRAGGAESVRFTEQQIPAYWNLARSFTLCERYFTDVAGPSTPNHLMLVAADSPVIDNPPGGFAAARRHWLYDLPTLPAALDRAGVSWGNYGGYIFDFLKETHGKQLPTSQFAADAAAGRLPAVSWLYSPNALSEHPADNALERAAGAGDVTKGSDWTLQQLQALVRGGLWGGLAFFVTWDDWGGWFDHVSPPELETWPADGTQFRYGSRVPCLVAGPYARSGHVSSSVTSHVSLVAFVERTFGLAHLNARTRSADPMGDCFDFSQPPLPPPAG